MRAFCCRGSSRHGDTLKVPEPAQNPGYPHKFELLRRIVPLPGRANPQRAGSTQNVEAFCVEGGEGREGERYYSRAKMAIFHVCCPHPNPPPRGREHIGAFLFFSSLHEDAIQGYFKFIPPYKRHHSVCRRHARIPGFYRMRAGCVATYPAHSIRVMAMVLRRRSKPTLFFIAVHRKFQTRRAAEDSTV